MSHLPLFMHTRSAFHPFSTVMAIEHCPPDSPLYLRLSTADLSYFYFIVSWSCMGLQLGIRYSSRSINGTRMALSLRIRWNACELKYPKFWVTRRNGCRRACDSVSPVSYLPPPLFVSALRFYTFVRGYLESTSNLIVCHVMLHLKECLRSAHSCACASSLR